MLGIHDLALFVLSGLLLNLTPGTDTLYILSHSATRGLRGGVAAALGIGAGCLLHIIAATVGLSAVLATSAAAFTVVKLLGAGYLVYLGLRMLLARAGASAQATPVVPETLATIFWRGALTNVLNPKVALFFLAFLPQFVDAGAAQAWAGFLVLGLLFNLNGTLWNLLLAWSGASVAGRIRAPARLATALNRGVGALFVALGVRLALAERN